MEGYPERCPNYIERGDWHSFQLCDHTDGEHYCYYPGELCPRNDEIDDAFEELLP